MSNFRTIRDLPASNNRSYVPLDVIPTKNNHVVPGTSTNNSPGTRVSVTGEIKGCFKALFGDFKFKSFTFICTMVQVAVFICAEIYALVEPGEKEHNYDCVLYKFGAAHTPSLVIYHQLYRLVTPMFLHADTGHIFSNLICQWSFGFRLEAIYGTKKFALLFFLSGIAGSLLSGVFHQDNIAVGASTACFGLIAWWCAHLIDNYDNLGPSRNRQIYWMVIMLIWNIAGASTNDRIDHQGHAGGFIGGVLLAVQFMKWTNDEKWRRKQKIALGLCILYAVGICIYLATLRNKLQKEAGYFYKICEMNLDWF